MLLAGTAQAAVRCTYDPATKIVLVAMSAEGDSATIARTPEGAITVNGTPCGEATVTNTETVNVEGGDQGTGESATIDINNGGFPGIKFNVTAFFELGVLTIEGTPGKDVISVGRGPLVGGIEKGGVDLDGDLTADVTFCLFPEECDTTGYFDSGIQSIIVNGHGGDDVLTGRVGERSTSCRDRSSTSSSPSTAARAATFSTSRIPRRSWRPTSCPVTPPAPTSCGTWRTSSAPASATT